MKKQTVSFGILGLAAIAAALIIGWSNPTLIEGENGVTCGAALLNSSVEGATESGEANCAVIRSERFVWSVTLLILGIGSVAVAAIPAFLPTAIVDGARTSDDAGARTSDDA